jgi:hypothetical protein
MWFSIRKNNKQTMKFVILVKPKKDSFIKDMAITPYNQNRLNEEIKKRPNARWKLTLDEDITDNMRKFFEGAVVPYFALQHSINGMPMSIETAREALKLEFNPSYAKNIQGNSVVVPGSTAKLNKEKFRAFVEKCIEYMERNGYDIPDSIDYKNWYDSAPLPGATYPPLKRLLDVYNTQKGITG